MIQNWGQNSAAKVDWQNMSGVHNYYVGVWWEGSTCLGRWYGDVSQSWPLFQASQHSQFTINGPLMWPPFSILRKILYFQPCFLPKFQLSRCKFAKFSFPRLLIFQRNPLLDPTFGNLRGTYLQKKKKVECPPPVVCLG